MARTIDFLPEAAGELEDALRWYQDIGSELATQFAIAVGDAVEQIAQFPGAGHPVSGPWRRVFLRRFPFALVYRVSGEMIFIDAVSHLSRLPGYWRDRV